MLLFSPPLYLLSVSVLLHCPLWALAHTDFVTSCAGIRVLVDAREKLHIPWGDPDNQQHGDSLMAFDTRSAMMANGQLESSIFLQYLPAIRALWADSGIQNAFDRRREFQLVGGCTHYIH